MWITCPRLLLSFASSRTWTHDLLITSPTPYSLHHALDILSCAKTALHICACSHSMPPYEPNWDDLIYFNKKADRLTWHWYTVARGSSECAQTLNTSSICKSFVTAVDFSKCFLYQWHPQLLPLGLHAETNQQQPYFSHYTAHLCQSADTRATLASAASSERESSVTSKARFHRMKAIFIPKQQHQNADGNSKAVTCRPTTTNSLNCLTTVIIREY